MLCYNIMKIALCLQGTLEHIYFEEYYEYISNDL